MGAFPNIPFLNTLDRSVGELLERRSRDSTGLLSVAAALTSFSMRQGHVCLDASNLEDSEFTDFFEPGFFDGFAEKLSSLNLVGSETEQTRPLILSNTGKLYFHRYWHYEKRLLGRIRKKLTKKTRAANPESLAEFVASFPSIGAEQKDAVERAVSSSLTLVSGGPGTGKTTTVLYTLAYMVKVNKNQDLRIALAAPTGKAAQRIQRSLESGLHSLSLSENEKNLIPTKAVTLHRLLGYIRNSSQFQYNRDVPLPYDMVIVDEASMLDLLMFSKLLDAVHSETQLILLGDRYQLSSVEAGSIFGDLVQASRTNDLLNQHTVELTHNYRFGNQSALYQTCEHVKSGEADEAILRIQGEGNEISMRPIPGPQKIGGALEKHLAPHFQRIARAENPQEALSLLEDVCLLTPIRRGIYGVEGLNAEMESCVRNLQAIPRNSAHFSGQPILIAENSYSQGLFNGDLGILFSSTENPAELFAYFRESGENSLRRFPLSALPAFELAYALTVHKSQGSEYQRVLFVIPPGDSPLVTRELIYTAISRSRNSVEIWGQPEDFIRGIQKQTRRSSGILDAMIE